jgi:putative salt-induced outer membrane protein YdiY
MTPTSNRSTIRSALAGAGRGLGFLVTTAGIVAAQSAPTARTLATAVPAEPAAPKTGFVADLGFLNTTGNTEVTTVNVAQKITHTRGFWRFEEQFGVIYGENAGEENTNLLRASLGAEYALRPWAALATGVLYDRNRFAGIARRTEQYLGFVFRPLSAARDTLRLETGASTTQQRGIDGVQNDFPAARAAAWYKHAFGARAFFLQTIETIPNLEVNADWRFNSESSLVAPLSKFVSLKAGYVLRYDNLPETDFRKSDRFVTTGLQVSF